MSNAPGAKILSSLMIMEGKDVPPVIMKLTLTGTIRIGKYNQE